MNFATAVRRLRTIAEDCERWSSVQDDDETGLIAAYTYGAILDDPGANLDVVDIALVVGLPAAGLPWGAEPPGCSSLAYLLRLTRHRFYGDGALRSGLCGTT